MEQRDFILREIEKISVVIMAILGKFRRIKSRKQIEQERTMIDKQLEEASGLTIDKLLSFKEEEIISFIDVNEGFVPGNMELLADLLIAFAENLPENESSNLINKAVIILEYVDRETKTFSMERSLKISCLRERL